MGDTQNLKDQEAVKKLKEIAEHKVCMLCTYTGEQELESRPMSVAGVDADGTIWFITLSGSTKMTELKQDNKVELIHTDMGKSEYLAITGNAQILRDQAKIDELWNPIAKAWVPEGKDDPALRLIKVTPTKGYYWDTKNGKLVEMLMIAASVVTGATNDNGIEGKLNVG